MEFTVGKMKTNNKFIANKLKNLFIIMSACVLIVSFQNCGQSAFQSRLPSKIQLASESSARSQDDESSANENDEASQSDENVLGSH